MHANQFNQSAPWVVEWDTESATGETATGETAGGSQGFPTYAEAAKFAAHRLDFQTLRAGKAGEQEKAENIARLAEALRTGQSPDGDDGEKTFGWPGFALRIRARAPIASALPQAVAELCHLFREEVRYCLSPAQLAAVDRDNARSAACGDFGVCATHDHCDANQCMLNAFSAVWGREPLANSDADIAAIDAAWDAAKSVGFSNTGAEG